jgi:hypothetical protein
MAAGMEAIQTSQSLTRQVLLLGTRIFTLTSIILEILRQYHHYQGKSQGSLCIHGMHVGCINQLRLSISMQEEAMDEGQVWELQDLSIQSTKQMKKTTHFTMLRLWV